jgi:aspartyl-tRNA(Asn)/glutamyl-tRNA(Gln) amidotransferase subunit C
VGGYTMRPRDADAITDGNKRDEVLANAPKAQFGCFVVPKVVDAG